MYCTIYSKSSRETQSQWSKLKKKKKSKQEAYWNTAPVRKSFSSQPVSVLVLNTYCTHSYYSQFWIQDGASPESKAPFV